MLSLNRTSILAGLEPGESETEHIELIKSALKLCDIDAANEKAVGSYWRFKIPRRKASDPTDLEKAAKRLSTLLVKSLCGHWEPAHSVGRTDGHWPRLDEVWLNSLLPETSEEDRMSLDTACLLLGIGPIPVGTEGNPPEIPADRNNRLPAAFMPELLKQWNSCGLSKFLEDKEIGGKLHTALTNWQWIHHLPESGIRVVDPSSEVAPAETEMFYAPNQMWLLPKQGGFTQISGLLPCLKVENAGSWYDSLNIRTPNDEKNIVRSGWISLSIICVNVSLLLLLLQQTNKN